jgi:hypothetical protein
MWLRYYCHKSRLLECNTIINRLDNHKTRYFLHSNLRLHVSLPKKIVDEKMENLNDNLNINTYLCIRIRQIYRRLDLHTPTSVKKKAIKENYARSLFFGRKKRFHLI